MSFLIPTEDLSIARREAMLDKAIAAGKQRMLDLKVVTERANAIERDSDYVTDFIPVATAAGLAGWLSMPLVAPVGGFVSVFANNVPAALTPAVPNNNVWCFYKVSVLVTAGIVVDPVSMIQFRTGTGANLKAQFDLEALYGKLSADGFFSQPVVYDPQEIVTCQVEVRIATGAGCRVRLGVFIFEPMQVTVV